MSNHLSEEQIAGQRSAELSASQWLEVHSHVAGCEECLSRLLSPEERERASASLLRDLTTDAEGHEHLSPEELEQFASGQMDEVDRETIASKIDACDECRADSQELKRFSGEMSRPDSASVVNFRHLPRLALAAAALLAVILAAWWFRSNDHHAAASVAHTTPVAPRSVARPNLPEQTAPPLPVVAPEQHLALRLADNGRTIGLDEKGALVGLDGLPDAERARIATLLRGGKLVRATALDRVTSHRVVLLGPESSAIPAVRLLEPVARVIETTQPTFRWTPVDGSTYELSIYDAHYEQAFSSGPLKVSEWAMPVPLSRGQTYSWQIAVLRDGQRRRFPAPPEPEAKFEVLSADAAGHIAELERSFGQSHLLMGVAYAEAGLVSRAEAELRKLEVENPDSAVARELVRNAAALHP